MEVAELIGLLERTGTTIDYLLSLSVFDGAAYTDLIDDLIVLSEDIGDVVWNVDNEGMTFVRA